MILILPDILLPEWGQFAWNEYLFEISPAPGQTKWHCQFMTSVDGTKVAFIGDSFQPPSRWNGTGGFCAYNNSEFSNFRLSAETLLKWQPAILCAGHSTYCYFSAPRFRKIMEWSNRAEEAARSIVPDGNLETNYYAIDPSPGKLFFI